jgi:hypothetical protein
MVSCWKKNVLKQIFKTGKFKGEQKALAGRQADRKASLDCWSENKTVEGLSERGYQELS